jgi:hypothetical protein
MSALHRRRTALPLPVLTAFLPTPACVSGRDFRAHPIAAAACGETLRSLGAPGGRTPACGSASQDESTNGPRRHTSCPGRPSPWRG